MTVDATPDQIWPWLAQVGWGRAGYYGYDWIDNGGKASAWEILSVAPGALRWAQSSR